MIHRCAATLSVFLAAVLCAGLPGRSASAEVLLGDIVGGGDGTGTAPPENVGIHADLGVLMTVHQNGDIMNSGENPVYIDDAVSPYIESVFLLNSPTMELNSFGVEYSFPAGDVHTGTWNHILANLTHDVDKGQLDVFVGGQAYPSGVGIHASAGITFDLDAIRATVANPVDVALFSAILGIDRCAGNVTNFVILSDTGEQGILDVFQGNFNANRGEPVQVVIPEEAKYLTLATGSAGDGIGCDHGVFADAKLSKAPKAMITRDIPAGLVNGTSGTVSLTVRPIFGGGVVVINEDLPLGLTASDPSHGAVQVGNGARWQLGMVTEQVVVTYTMTAGPDAVDGPLEGTATADGEPVTILGDVSYTGSPFSIQGFIKTWNHLDPLAFAFPAPTGDHGPPGACDANNGADLGLDWIVNEDGSVTEADIAPFPNMITRPKYGGTGLPGGGARAAGVVIAPGDVGEVVQDRFTVWKGTTAPTDTIDHISASVSGFDAEDHLTMSVMYVTVTDFQNPGHSSISTTLGLASDDAIQILVNDVNITEDPLLPGVPGIIACRGYGGSNTEQNQVPVTLNFGENRVLVKVTDGCCGSGFRLRFHDPASPDPLAPLPLKAPFIRVSLESETGKRPLDAVRSFARRTFGPGETVDVSLTISPRGPSPRNTLAVREILPAGVTVLAGSISNGGQVVGNAIEWNVARQVDQALVLAYRLVPEDCVLDVRYVDRSYYGLSGGGQSLQEAIITGDTVLARSYQNDTDLGPWDNRGISASGGAAQKKGDHDIAIKGSGAGLRLQADQFHFVSSPASGDYEVAATVTCLGDPSIRGSAGVMVRNTLDDFSAHVFFGVTNRPPTAGGVATLTASFRRDTGKTTSLFQATDFTDAEKAVAQFPIHLKIKKAGALLTLERRSEGEPTYTEVARKEIGTAAEPLKIVINSDPRVGLAVTSGGATTDTFVNFTNVSGPSFNVAVPPPTLTSATGGSKKVTLAWTAPAGPPAPERYVIYRDGARLTEVPAPQTTYEDSGLADDTSFCYRVAAKVGGSESVRSAELCARTLPVGKLFRRGDLNTDQAINLTDAINLLGALFLGSPELITCRDAADVDDSGNLNLTDAIYLLSYSFQGGDEPPAPGPKICGLDPTADSPLPPVNGELGCLSEVICVSRP